MTTIPALELVNVNPSVLPVGGSGLDITALLLTPSTRVPIGTVATFASQASVAAYFGAVSAEATWASTYFLGFDGSNKKPAAMLAAQYNQSAVSAYLRGGNISSMTLAALQALSGSLTLTVDGYPHVLGSVSLAAATSFSSAAAIILAALPDPTESTFTASIGATFTGTGSGTNLTTSAVTGLISVGDTITGTGVPASTTIVSQTSGTPGGAGVYVTSNATTSAGASLVASSTVVNVTVLLTGTIAVGQTVTGTSVPISEIITAQLTGTPGGAGTYRMSGAQSQVVSESMSGLATQPTIVYDSVSGAFVVTSQVTGAASLMAFATGTLAAPLLLTQATGAVLSQGAAAVAGTTAGVAAFMNAVVVQTTAWVNFSTLVDPDAFAATGNAVKQAFAAWKNTQNNRYGYVCWDNDATAATTLPASTSLGQILAANGDSGTAPEWTPDNVSGPALAAFLCGAAASIDFTQRAGRITFAFKSQAGLAATVTDPTTALNLGGNPQAVPAARGNGYNFYGAYASATASFVWFQRGFVTGPYLWFDSYVNQVWLNNSLQVAMLSFLQAIRSIPYNAAGNSLIEQALQAPIQAGLNFGAFAPGAMSASQIAAVNAAAGTTISDSLQAQGYYLQVLAASSAARAARASPPITFWYLDRGAVQSINIGSIAVQ